MRFVSPEGDDKIGQEARSKRVFIHIDLAWKAGVAGLTTERSGKLIRNTPKCRATTLLLLHFMGGGNVDGTVQKNKGGMGFA